MPYSRPEAYDDATLGELEAASLDLIATHDDLALEGHVVERVTHDL